MPTRELLAGKNIGDGFNFKVNIMSPCGDVIASLPRKTTWPLGPPPTQTVPKKRGKPRLTNPKKHKQSTKPAKGKKKMTKEDKANRVSLLQSQGALPMTMAPPRSTSSGSLHLDLFAGPPPTLHLCPPGAAKPAFRRLQPQKLSVRRGPALGMTGTAGKQQNKSLASTKTRKNNDVRNYMTPTKPRADQHCVPPPPVKKTKTRTSTAGRDPFAFQHIVVGDEPVPKACIEDPKTEEIEDDTEPFRALLDSLGQSRILFRLQSTVTHLVHTSGNITTNTHHTTQT